jgi:hypothetical protein
MICIVFPNKFKKRRLSKKNKKRGTERGQINKNKDEVFVF